MGPATPEDEFDGTTLFFGQPSYGLANLFDEVHTLDDVLGTATGVHLRNDSWSQPHQACSALLSRVAPSVLSEGIDRTAMRLHSQERPQRASGRVEALGMPPQGSHDVLEHLFCHNPRPRHPMSHAHDEGAVAIEDFTQRVVVASDEPGHERALPLHGQDDTPDAFSDVV